MKPTRILMTASAATLAVLGLIATFAPDLLLRAIGGAADANSILLMQVLGALYMGFAALNWMARGNLVGGIYSRPVVAANLMHFLIAGIALIKHVAAALAAVAPLLWAITLAYPVFAIAFGYVLMRHPLAAPRPTAG